ncbi:unnamed protein product [Cylindrotheca closterium]|uniref:Uncharacterized protein n=1 Tax=Cylindrotheca closterium TaxID=2856 RepID=A0AAD2CVF9_9STRA|nr:unnamed protein product [Cylindrotheca closterium]
MPLTGDGTWARLEPITTQEQEPIQRRKKQAPRQRRDHSEQWGQDRVPSELNERAAYCARQGMLARQTRQTTTQTQLSELRAEIAPLRSNNVAAAVATEGSSTQIVRVTIGNRLNHSLINPNQTQSFGIPLWDSPFDEMRHVGIESKILFKLLFDSRTPTEQELATCLQVDMTSKLPWNPGTVQLGKVSVAHKDPEDHVDDPRSNEAELRLLDPIMQGMKKWCKRQ